MRVLGCEGVEGVKGVEVGGFRGVKDEAIVLVMRADHTEKSSEERPSETERRQEGGRSTRGWKEEGR